VREWTRPDRKRQESLSTIRILLDRGAAINEKDDSGKTILHWAVEEPEEEVLPLIQMLLKYGVEVEARDHWGYTALIRAAGVGNVKAMEYLLASHGMQV
jgi:ankyrin repeat protein